MNEINKNYNVTEIEGFLYTLLYNKVGKSTYLTSPPIKLDAVKDTNFIVISLPTSLRDYDAYGEAKVRIELFAKSNERGLQDNVTLRDMQNKLITELNTFNALKHSKYILQPSLNTFMAYDSTLNYHININFFNLIIK